MNITTCYDTHSCLRCFSCMVNCSVENRARLKRDKGIDIARSVNQDRAELSALTLEKHQVGQYPDAKEFTEFKHCRHCEKAKCIDMCPANAIVRTKTGSVVIRENVCVGCRACQDGCPYNVPTFSGETGKTYKCIQCHDRTAAGMKPACVEACPTDAMFSGNRDEVLAEARKRAELYTAKTGMKYLVYGGDKINSFVGQANWITIAPEADRDEYGLPANPYKASFAVRKMAKMGGGALAAATLAGTACHFFYWLTNRKKAVAESEVETRKVSKEVSDE